jgi:hypothetical protein
MAENLSVPVRDPRPQRIVFHDERPQISRKILGIAVTAMRFERDCFQRHPIVGAPVANQRKRGRGDSANLGPLPPATGILECELIVPMLAGCLIMADVVDTLVLDLSLSDDCQ